LKPRNKRLLPRKEFFPAARASCDPGHHGPRRLAGHWDDRYHVFENLPWVDAFVNASMILSGMGPVATLQTTGGKIFCRLLRYLQWHHLDRHPGHHLRTGNPPLPA